MIVQTTVKEGLKNNRLIASRQDGQGKLGSLFWYSISQQLISRERLKRTFDEAAMDQRWLPNPIRPADAFRRATWDVQKKLKKVETPTATIFLNFLIREVYSDHKRVQRNIVIEQVDKKGRKLAYNPTATVIEFNKESGSISISASRTMDWGEQNAKELALDAKDRFETYCRHYDAQTLRAMVKKVLASLSPTAVRPSGGVYFVPRHHQNELDRVVDLVSRLEGSEAFAVPLFNTKSNRGIVNSKLREDVLSVLSKCRMVMEGPDLKKSRITETLNEARRVVKTFHEYQSIVHLDLEVLNDSLAELKELAVGLMEKAK